MSKFMPFPEVYVTVRPEFDLAYSVKIMQKSCFMNVHMSVYQPKLSNMNKMWHKVNF